jgi:hypothetical protein
MKFQLSIQAPPLPQPIRYSDKILLIGSCFTEHMSNRLAAHKFRVLQNPHGILFNPFSVAKSLLSYANDHSYKNENLFYLNELWGSWDHHTRFSHIDPDEALKGINESQKEAGIFIKEADWIIITLGSSFQYLLNDSTPEQIVHSTKKIPAPDLTEESEIAWNRAVANNHRAPAAWFEKRLLSIAEIHQALSGTLAVISQLNPKVRFLFTISPVRHIRDGVTENNRSKARLIEVVHQLCQENDRCHYFPAYEYVIDVLRDYRFYDIDMVHPNYAATEAVWEVFVANCLDPNDLPLLKDLHELVRAKNHLPRFPKTESHQKFLKNALQKAEAIQAAYPFLDLGEELRYFKGI